MNLFFSSGSRNTSPAQDKSLHDQSAQGCSCRGEGCLSPGAVVGTHATSRGPVSVPGAAVNASDVFLAAQWLHARLSGGISISVMAVRHRRREHSPLLSISRYGHFPADSTRGMMDTHLSGAPHSLWQCSLSQGCSGDARMHPIPCCALWHTIWLPVPADTQS